MPKLQLAVYGSSKAALQQISETLRLEMSPFGVTVITLMAGVIATNFDANATNFHLPRDSYYYPIEDIMSKWASGELKGKGCSAQEFAQSVVGDVEGKTNTGYAWRGTNAALVRTLKTYAPNFVVVSVCCNLEPNPENAVCPQCVNSIRICRT